jgi:predicted esterase
MLIRCNEVSISFVGLLAVLACGQAEQAGPIAVQNASGRSGAYYIPRGSASKPVPVLVILHGSGGSGQGAIDGLRELANRRHFAIIAPDSRELPGGGFTWEVGDKQGDVTPDLTHTLNCIDWVRSHTHLVVDESHVLIAGFSGGGSSAPYIASNRPGFTAAAVLHGGVFAGGIGARRFPVWISTGEQDRYRPPSLVQQAAMSLTNLGFSNVTFRTYPGGHELRNTELSDLIDWWLGR